MKKYLNPRGLAIVDALSRIADAHGATPAQVALAWLMSRPGVTAPIASATSVEQLEELFGATRLTLGEGDLTALDRASAP
jgi:aryl-alcohol dehydrogenase-like predicted oxidoreductase